MSSCQTPMPSDPTDLVLRSLKDLAHGAVALDRLPESAARRRMQQALGAAFDLVHAEWPALAQELTPTWKAEGIRRMAEHRACIAALLMPAS